MGTITKAPLARIIAKVTPTVLLTTEALASDGGWWSVGNFSEIAFFYENGVSVNCKLIKISVANTYNEN